MKSKLWIVPLMAVGLAGAPALAASEPAQVPAAKEARIPFADHGGIRDWHFADRDTLYVQDRHRNWYEATLMTPVTGWRGQWAIGFETRGVGSFDRFSTVVVDGWRYPVSSLVRVDGPPSFRSEIKRDKA